MKINIRGNKIEVTESIKDYVTEKISKLDKYFKDASECECFVLIKVKGKEETIEVTVPTHKFTLRAEESNEDLYAAVDLVIDKLERQIRKNKTKINKKFKVAEFTEIESLDVPEETDEKIIKRKNIDMKPMNEEEAILQMELLNHDFYVFKNVDEKCVSILYKRKDGELGIINTK